MRTKLILLAGLVVVLAVGIVGAAYAYDHSKRNVIAQGVKVNGVPIGGLTAAQAQAKLSDALLAPLNRPVKVRYHHRTFTLTPKQAQVAINIGGTVDKALATSHQGSMFSRAWRNLRGQSLDTQLAADVSYSQPAIDALVKRVQRRLDRKAEDASLDLSKGQVEPKYSSTGLRVRYVTLARDIRRTLLQPGTSTVRVHTTTIKPEVTTAQIAAKYPSIIIVNRSQFKLTLYKGLKVKKTYGIAVGRIGLETPAGLYTIQNKEVNPAWHVPNSAWAGDLAGKVIPPDDPGNPIKARWMGIYAGAGIHGTNEDGSIGSAASHGCIRMHIPDVEELYDQVSVGTPVYIA